MGKGAGEKNGASPGSPVLGSLSPTQISEPARRLHPDKGHFVVFWGRTVPFTVFSPAICVFGKLNAADGEVTL